MTGSGPIGDRQPCAGEPHQQRTKHRLRQALVLPLAKRQAGKAIERRDAIVSARRSQALLLRRPKIRVHLVDVSEFCYACGK
jgi:hypothetical protein